MRDVHPSPSASDGRSILKSEFIQPTDPVEHFVECAQCGFPKNLDKQAEGPIMGSDDVSQQEDGIQMTPISYNSLYTSVFSLPQALQSCSANYIGTFSRIEPKVMSMCPFCGSGNSRGVGRDSDPFAQSRDFRNAW